MIMKLSVTDDIILEQIALSHSKELFALIDANRDYLREWLPWLDYSMTVDDTQSFISTTIEQFESGKGPQFVILYKGKICGVVGFHPFDVQNQKGGIGYWIGQSFSGLGIVTASVKKLIELGFGSYGLNKIEIGCAEDNEKSKAIPIRLGFTLEATLREEEWLYNKYVNQCLFTKLKSEYNA